MRISIEEWLKELDGLQAAQPDGFTTRELAAAKNVSQQRAGEIMRNLVHGGVMICSGRRRETSMDGKPCYVPVYKIAAGNPPKAVSKKKK